jgi:soluble lytic murein transglycosylase
MMLFSSALRVAAAALVLLSVAAGLPGAARAAIGIQPSQRPIHPSPVVPGFPERLARAPDLLDDHDKDLFGDAYDAVRQHNWPHALNDVPRIHNRIAAKLITWAYLTASDTTPGFQEIVRFLADNPDWPRRATLLAKAEKALPKGMPPAQVIAWFGGQEPLTGEGMIRLGQALIDSGKTDYGARWIALAWSAHDFTNARQQEIYATYKDYLKGQPTIDRVSRLLWSYEYTKAAPLLADLPARARKKDEARIALMKGTHDAMAKVRALPRADRDDPGVVFNEVQYFRRNDEDDKAQHLLLAVKDPDKVPHPERWWVERNVQARKARSDKHYRIAYEIAAHSGLKEGGNFAAAEFLAGWIALRYLKDPARAEEHFHRLAENVGYPISLARAYYWEGRAEQARSKPSLAAEDYKKAAQYPYTFYGQLGAESPLLANTLLDLPKTPTADHATWGPFLDNELVKAIRILSEIDGEVYMRTLAYHLADEAKTPADFVLLAEFLRSIDEVAISVRVAKVASRQHIFLPYYLYPKLDLPDYPGGGGPEPALVLGLVRQESEFNPRAVSGAGARGIMQLIPSTAHITANKHGLPYRPGGLATDIDYNLTIGMAHLGDLLERYDGSYILAITAYNAGHNRVDQWIAKMGDPRTKSVDPIDWIESIPFSETRNYVQRVLENAAVYRHLIAGRPVAFTLRRDLYGTAPPDLSYLKPAPPPPAATAAPTPPPATQPVSSPAETDATAMPPMPEARPADSASQPAPTAADVQPRPTIEPDPHQPEAPATDDGSE